MFRAADLPAALGQPALQHVDLTAAIGTPAAMAGALTQSAAPPPEWHNTAASSCDVCGTKEMTCG